MLSAQKNYGKRDILLLACKSGESALAPLHCPRKLVKIFIPWGQKAPYLEIRRRISNHETHLHEVRGDAAGHCHDRRCAAVCVCGKRRPVHGCEGHRLVCFERSVRL